MEWGRVAGISNKFPGNAGVVGVEDLHSVCHGLWSGQKSQSCNEVQRVVLSSSLSAQGFWECSDVQILVTASAAPHLEDQMTG